jgi:hypothetical protein
MTIAHPPLAAAFALALSCLAAPAQDAPSRVMEATFKLYNKDSTATCLLIQPAGSGAVVLVTAAHVLKRMGGDEALLVLRRPKDDGVWERVDHPVAVRAQGKDLWTAHPTHDAAALRVTLPAGVPVRPLPIACLADEAALAAAKARYGSQLHILGYPTRFEANSAGFPILRHGSIASHPLVPTAAYPTFLADFTTFSGDSGGPVILAADGVADPLVLGLVLSQRRNDEKVTSMYEERTIHTPLMLSDILHATYLRETIALLPAE